MSKEIKTLEDVFTSVGLGDYPRIEGSGGRLDYFVIYKNNDIRVGIKFAIEPTSSDGDVRIICRIRVVGSGRIDIFNTESYVNAMWPEDMQEVMRGVGLLRKDSTRVSVAIPGEPGLHKLGSDFEANSALIIAGFTKIWGSVSKKANQVVLLMTGGDTVAGEQVYLVSEKLLTHYCPEAPVPKKDKGKNNDNVIPIGGPSGEPSVCIPPDKVESEHPIDGNVGIPKEIMAMTISMLQLRLTNLGKKFLVKDTRQILREKLVNALLETYSSPK